MPGSSQTSVTYPFDAIVEVFWTLVSERTVDIFDDFILIVFGMILRRALGEFLGTTQVFVCLLSRNGEEASEVVTCPFDRVFDHVGEITERTHGDRRVGRIIGGRIGFSEEWNHYLNTSLGTHGATVNQRLLVVHTSSINVLT